MKHSVLAILLTVVAAHSAYATTTALEAVEAKRNSVQTRVDRNYYRSAMFKDVKAILDEKGYGQVGANQYGQNAQTYMNPANGGSIGGAGGAGTGKLTPAQQEYQDAMAKLTNEFNARASNDQRAIDNYRAELEQSAGKEMSELQARLNQYMDAQKVLQDQARSAYENQIAALGANPTDTAVASLRAAYASNYAYASSVYKTAIDGLKAQYEAKLADYNTLLSNFANTLNYQRQMDYYAALTAIPQP